MSIDLNELNTTWVWFTAFILVVLLFISKIGLVARLANRSEKEQKRLNEDLKKARAKLAKEFNEDLKHIDLDLDVLDESALSDLNADRLLEQSPSFKEFKARNTSENLRKRAKSAFDDLDQAIVKKPSNLS